MCIRLEFKCMCFQIGSALSRRTLKVGMHARAKPKFNISLFCLVFLLKRDANLHENQKSVFFCRLSLLKRPKKTDRTSIELDEEFFL